MMVQRSARFDADLEQRFRWYLLDTGLDPAEALKLATRFAIAADKGLERLRMNPGLGRPRFKTFPDLEGIRSWKLGRPFNRFLIFYRVEGGILFAERLLEGHRRIAGGK